jgi:putative oxidoreductase
MVVHGWMKLTDIAGTQGAFATMGIPEPEVAAYLAVAGELFGGLGLLVGLLTPIAGLGVLCTMIVAIAYAHFSNGLLAQNGGFEYPLTLGLVALYFVARGAGPVSLDAWLARRRAATAAPESGRRHYIPGQRPHHVGT